MAQVDGGARVGAGKARILKSFYGIFLDTGTKALRHKGTEGGRRPPRGVGLGKAALRVDRAARRGVRAVGQIVMVNR